eukprot:c41368_g1_i1 orf=3-254(-)
MGWYNMSGSCEGWTLAAGALVVSLLASLLQKVIISRRAYHSNDDFPPGPPALPIIGHLHLFLSGCFHHSFAELARTHGPIIGLR